MLKVSIWFKQFVVMSHTNLIHTRGDVACSSTGSPAARRFLLYSHDGLGLGHTRRNLAIASALCRLASDVTVLLATGADEINRFGLPRQVEILKLPALRKLANNRYGARYLRVTASGILAIRSALLRAAVESFQPCVMLVDKHPLGVGGELRAALDLFRSGGGRTALGLRDILDEPATVLREWQRYNLPFWIGEFYDTILVYGQRDVFDPVREYRFPDAIAERTHFCGYVVNSPSCGKSPEAVCTGNSAVKTRPLVIATPGGGEDGFQLLHAFIAASRGASWEALAISGPMTPDHQHEQLRREASDAGVAFQTFVPNLPGLLCGADALVCMGGYNTLTEALCCGVPTLCVPRMAPRSEQLLRAEAFARRGLLYMLHPKSLSPERLHAGIEVALADHQHRSLLPPRCLQLDGANRAGQRLLELAAATSPKATGTLAISKV